MVPNKLVRFSEIPLEAEGHCFPTGWHELDRHLIIYPGLLVVVTGTPGHGKSQWVIALCANLARIHGLRGAFLQFEDNPNRNRADLLAYARSWHGSHARYIDCDPAVWLDQMFLTIAPTTSVEDDDYTLDWVTSAIEEAATQHGCRWLIVDPWNEIEHLWRVNETETAYTVKALKHLKTLAQIQDHPVRCDAPDQGRQPGQGHRRHDFVGHRRLLRMAGQGGHRDCRASRK